MTEEEAENKECPFFGLVEAFNSAASSTYALMSRAFPVHGQGSVSTVGAYGPPDDKPDNPCIHRRCMMWTGSDCGLKALAGTR